MRRLTPCSPQPKRDLSRVRTEMYAVALPLHRQWFPDHKDHSDLSGDALQNKVIAEVIDRINQDHVEPGQLLEKVKARGQRHPRLHRAEGPAHPERS